MNRLIAILLALTFCSCEQFCSVTSFWCSSSTENIESIDFTQVDQYPKFSYCNEALNLEESKQCFEKAIYNQISEQMQNLELSTEDEIIDTLQIQFTVNNEGAFLCDTILASEMLTIKFPELSSTIADIIKALPVVSPAQKRGIPVTSTYTIPLVIDTQ